MADSLAAQIGEPERTLGKYTGTAAVRAAYDEPCRKIE
jgi:hypothetical protein